MQYYESEQKVYDMDIMKKLLPIIWFIVKFAWKIVSGIATLLLVAFCGYEGNSRRHTAHQESNSDSAWDIHPRQYYDKDPPPPFS